MALPKIPELANVRNNQNLGCISLSSTLPNVLVCEVKAQTSEEEAHVEEVDQKEESEPQAERRASAKAEDRVRDGRLVHKRELSKHVNILMKKEASIFTVRERNYQYGMGENYIELCGIFGLDLVYWYGPMVIRIKRYIDTDT